MTGVMVSLIAQPAYKSLVMAYWQNKFAKLTFLCDQSMRLHFIAKQKVAASPDEETIKALKAAEIGLLDCQTYDLMQKKLIRFGLTDNEIGEMVLRSAESNANTMRKVVGIHEINY